MIHGSRLRQARELRGGNVKQSQIAAALGVSVPRVSQIERSGLDTDDHPNAAELLARMFGVRPSFFTVPIAEQLSEGSLRFRARKSLTKRGLAQILREAELAHEIAHSALTVVEAPDSRVPVMPQLSPIEEAAQATRGSLGLPPDEPISNVWRALERAGVFVYRLGPTTHERLDAFSTWTGELAERPIIAVSDHLSWDRDRMTAAHELAHLVLHRAAAAVPHEDDRVERDANRFASAFLLPLSAARRELPRPFTLARLAPLKARWGMSMASLVQRAAEVGHIGPDEARYLNIQISKRGWRKGEPGATDRLPDRPRALLRMVELAYGNPVDTRRLALELGRFESDVARELARYEQAPGRQRAKSFAAPDRVRASNVVSLTSRRQPTQR